MSETPSKFKTEAEWVHHLVERSATADRLESDLDRIRRMAFTGTASNWLKLSDEDKRLTFAIGIRESSLRKKAEDELHMLRLHLADKNADLSAMGGGRQKLEQQLAAKSAEIERLKAALAEARKDAERYRKLKAMFDHGGVTIRLIGEVDKLGIPLVTYEYTEWEPLQSAIDAARGQP